MEKPNFSKIAEAIDLTRQTVSKEYAMIKEEDWDKFDIKNFYEGKNKYERAYLILSDLDEETYSLNQVAKLLGTSRSNLSKYFNLKIISAVYGCFYQGNLIYIGSTSDYHSRIQQHWSEIQNKNKEKKLYEFLADKNKEDIEFRPFITELDRSVYQDLEKSLIKWLNPICNVEFL